MEWLSEQHCTLKWFVCVITVNGNESMTNYMSETKWRKNVRDGEHWYNGRDDWWSLTKQRSTGGAGQGRDFSVMEMRI